MDLGVNLRPFGNLELSGFVSVTIFLWLMYILGRSSPGRSTLIFFCGGVILLGFLGDSSLIVFPQGVPPLFSYSLPGGFERHLNFLRFSESWFPDFLLMYIFL